MLRFEEPHAAHEPQFGHPWFEGTLFHASCIFTACTMLFSYVWFSTNCYCLSLHIIFWCNI